MKGSVEDRNHRHIVPQRRPRNVDPSQTSRVGQRRQLAELFDLGYDGAVDANGLREPLSSMHDTMTHRVYTRAPKRSRTH